MSGGGGGGGGLSKIGTALIIVLVISLVALFAQLFYALWRRRVFHRQINRDHLSIYDSDSSDSTVSSSKELLFFFFCIRQHSRVDSNSITATSTTDDRNSNRRSNMEVVDIDLLKIQGIFAPPRFLFTIKEEELEDLESIADKSLFPPDKEANKIDNNNRICKVISLEECFTAAEQSAVVVEIDVDGERDATPFSTPCESPTYFTPSSSPVHEGVNSRSREEGMISSEFSTAPFIRSEV